MYNDCVYDTQIFSIMYHHMNALQNIVWVENKVIWSLVTQHFRFSRLQHIHSNLHIQHLFYNFGYLYFNTTPKAIMFLKFKQLSNLFSSKNIHNIQKVYYSLRPDQQKVERHIFHPDLKPGASRDNIIQLLTSAGILWCSLLMYRSWTTLSETVKLNSDINKILAVMKK